MTEEAAEYSVETIIRTVRGQKVILDSDLAKLYGVRTKALNQAVQRNQNRFPAEFAFRLTWQELVGLASSAPTAGSHPVEDKQVSANRSQIVTGSQKHRDPRHLPYAFTEYGAIMAANILRSRKAEEMSVFIVRTFVRMRQALLSRTEMEKRLGQIENILLVHDDALKELFDRIRPLLLPPSDPPPKPIGFGVRERRARYKGP